MTTTGVKLTKNDGSEEFVLKASSVEEVKGMSVVTRAVVSALNELVGIEPELRRVTYNISLEIIDMDAADYPNSGTYSDHDYGFSKELSRAVEDWGYTTSDGFDTLTWDGRTINGAFSNLTLEESLDQGTTTRHYVVTIEWAHYDVGI